MISTIQDFLEQYQWTFQKISDSILLTGFVDDSEMGYPITIEVRDEFVLLFITFQPDENKLFIDNTHLVSMLRINFLWPVVKVGLDESNAITLSIDLFRQSLSYNIFSDSLDVLTETAQMLVKELDEVIISEEG